MARVDTTNFYWSHNGKYQAAADQLQALIPHSGSVAHPYKNKCLERFRKAVNCYHDLYNNGLWNRKSAFSKLFKIVASEHEYGHGKFTQHLYDYTEQMMDRFIEEAAKEQHLPL